MSKIPLGQFTEYPQEYAPGVLFPIPRDDARRALGLGAQLPFHGRDIWNAWELTWLNRHGKPVIATATFQIDAGSPNIVESKSMKLYLNSLAMSRYESATDVAEIIASDLSDAAGARVDVVIACGPESASAAINDLPGTCIDDLPMGSLRPTVDPGLLLCLGSESITEALHTHLFRSNCPVTNQPDFGSILVNYEGPRIDPAALLGYIASFRQHNDFHEACIERMFVDLSERCSPGKLTVYARFTRRGGLDINPFRSNFEDTPENLRLWRQ